MGTNSLLKTTFYLLARKNFFKKGRKVSLSFLCKYANISNEFISEELKPLMNKNVLCITHQGIYVVRDSLVFAILDFTEDDINDAYKKGALAVVTNRRIEGKPCIVVDNPLMVYAKMTNYYRTLSSSDITAIVGSIGKTTTKLMCGAVFSNCERTLYEKGNLNNIRRVLHVCQHLPQNSKQIICEISEADYGTCEAASLALNPKVAIITAIDKSHMEGYGSEEEIKRQICSISKYMSEDGVVIVNKDEFSSFNYLYGKKIITISQKEKADYYSQNVVVDERGLHFEVVDSERGECTMVNLYNVYGLHNVGMALQVYAAALYMGFPTIKIVKGFERFKPLGIRQNAFRTLNNRVVYADCFNAVAKSIESAMLAARNIPIKSGCKKIAVLADVEEAGLISEETHKQIVEIVNSSDFRTLLAYGPKLNKALDEIELRDGITLIRCQNKNQIVGNLRHIAKSGDLILFKSSHSWRLDKCIKRMWPISYYRRMVNEYLSSVLFRIGIELR